MASSSASFSKYLLPAAYHPTAPQPLYIAVHYYPFLDITQIKDGPHIEKLYFFVWI